MPHAASETLSPITYHSDTILYQEPANIQVCGLRMQEQAWKYVVMWDLESVSSSARWGSAKLSIAEVYNLMQMKVYLWVLLWVDKFLTASTINIDKVQWCLGILSYLAKQGRLCNGQYKYWGTLVLLDSFNILTINNIWYISEYFVPLTESEFL